MRGGAESSGNPCDQCSSGVAPPASVSIENHRSEEDAFVVERSLERLVLGQTLTGRCVRGAGFLVDAGVR